MSDQLPAIPEELDVLVVLLVKHARCCRASLLAFASATPDFSDECLTEVRCEIVAVETLLEFLSARLGAKAEAIPTVSPAAVARIGDVNDALQALHVAIALESRNPFAVPGHQEVDASGASRDPLVGALAVVSALGAMTRSMAAMRDPSLPVEEVIDGPWNVLVPRRLKLLAIVRNSLAAAKNLPPIPTEWSGPPMLP